jgi:predicted nucleotidyltransferase
MTSLAVIRQRSHSRRLATLREGIAGLLPQHPGAEVWLFGSLARGDWDAFSDVDLLAVAPTPPLADALADALLAESLADDVIALSQSRWQSLRGGDDPYWRAIGREALRLDQP